MTINAKVRALAHAFLLPKVAVRLLLGAGAVMACVGLGYTLAHTIDDRRLDGQREILRNGMQEFRALIDHNRSADPRLLRLLSNVSGLETLTFETEVTDGTREVQPVVDTGGRILGFLTWEPQRSATQTVNRFLPFGLGVALVSMLAVTWSRRRRPRSQPAAVAPAPVMQTPVAPPADANETAESKMIRRELPGALAAKTFNLHYQPIVAANGGRIVGVEALLRWNHTTHGLIPPATFIPIAEQMGVMDELGEWVLNRALNDGKRWPDLYVAVNLSPVQVRDGRIVETVKRALAESTTDPARLLLEVTEGVLIDNPDEMQRRLEDLRALGCRIALDDFGSGYSNLSYLNRFPFDKLKIDRAFVKPLGRSGNGAVIMQAMIALGRALGVTVLVEGVETEEQRVLLRLAGCDEMQGFLFSRPASRDAIDRLLARPRVPAPARTAAA